MASHGGKISGRLPRKYSEDSPLLPSSLGTLDEGNSPMGEHYEADSLHASRSLGNAYDGFSIPAREGFHPMERRALPPLSASLNLQGPVDVVRGGVWRVACVRARARGTHGGHRSFSPTRCRPKAGATCPPRGTSCRWRAWSACPR